jgi:hypothetical protein
MKKYKVMTLEANSPFSPEKLEQDLNGYAEQGWKVISCTSGQFYQKAIRNEIIIILEKGA